MVCRYCGNNIPEGCNVCPYCFQPVENSESQKQGLSNSAKAIIIAAAAAFLVILFVIIGVAASSGSGSSSSSDTEVRESSILPGEAFDITVKDYDEAMVALDAMGYYYGYESAADVYSSSETVRETGLFTAYYFDQMYEGIPVAGHNSKVIVDEDGSLLNVVGNYTEISGVETEARVDEQTAVEAAVEAAAEAAEAEAEAETGTQEETEAEAAEITEGDYTAKLCVYVPEETETPVLAWNIVYGYYSFYVDANTGEVIDSFDLVDEFETADKKQKTLNLTGQNTNEGTKSVNVLYDSTEKMYYMYDWERNYAIYSEKKVDLNNYDEIPDSKIVSFKKEKKANKAAVDAEYNIGRVYDFYSNVLNHASFDGNGEADLYVTVDTKKYTNNGEKEKITNNAAALPTVEENEGILMLAVTDGDYDSSYYYDVVAHEYTHLVEHFIVGSDVFYSSEWKAMNEAFADIMSASSGGYYSDDGQIDWVLDDWYDGRNIANPGEGYAVQYEDYDPNGEEHYNSTVLSHVAYTMNCGDILDECKITDYETLAQLWYNALYLMTPYADLDDCREAVERVAEIMVEKGMLTQMQYAGVIASFSLAGIPCVSEIYCVTDDTEIRVLAADMNNGGEIVEYQDYSYDVSEYNASIGPVVRPQNSGQKGSETLTVEELRGDNTDNNKFCVEFLDWHTAQSSSIIIVIWDNGAENTNSFFDVNETNIDLLTDFGSSTYVSGTVVDEDENPVAGATVSLENLDNWGQTASVTTDENGEYRLFLYYESQEFTLKFEKEGCETATATYTLSAEQLSEASRAANSTCNLGKQVLKRYKVPLEGYVYDEESNPLDGVTISVNCEDSEALNQELSTNSEGYYALEVYADETYSIEYSMEEYAAVTNNLSATNEMIENAKQNVTTKLEDVKLSKIFGFSDMEGIEFIFESGAGAWATKLNINADGTFSGEYFDYDIGIDTCWNSIFSGKFSEPQVISETIYSTTVESLNIETPTGTQEWKDDHMYDYPTPSGIEYYYTTPSGIDNGDAFIIYLPGTPVSEIDESAIEWLQISCVYEEIVKNNKLKRICLFNSSYESAFWDNPF